jgi:hypothetical protein
VRECGRPSKKPPAVASLHPKELSHRMVYNTNVAIGRPFLSRSGLKAGKLAPLSCIFHLRIARIHCMEALSDVVVTVACPSRDPEKCHRVLRSEGCRHK